MLDFQMRDSADAVQITSENQSIVDCIENYGSDAGETSMPAVKPIFATKSPEPISRKGGEESITLQKPKERSTSLTLSPQGDADGRLHADTHTSGAIRKTSRKGKASDLHPRDETHAATEITGNTNPARDKIDGAHPGDEAQSCSESVDLRFADPLVLEIVQLHRMRRRWMKAKNALVLQGKAFSRALSGGDKDVGSKAFDNVLSGKISGVDETLLYALSPFLPAIEKFDDEMAVVEKRMVKLAKKLPVAAWVLSVSGFGMKGFAEIVGESGDLSKYHSVSAVWKRLGLAVIDGEGRQRKVTDADRALLHGYSPERRAITWVIADSMSKHQRTWLDKVTGEVKKEPGPYGVILEREKEKALAAGCTKAHAEARGKRHMTKALIKDLVLQWRGIV